jgi:hypothetical protein
VLAGFEKFHCIFLQCIFLVSDVLFEELFDLQILKISTNNVFNFHNFIFFFKKIRMSIILCLLKSFGHVLLNIHDVMYQIATKFGLINKTHLLSFRVKSHKFFFFPYIILSESFFQPFGGKFKSYSFYERYFLSH